MQADIAISAKPSNPFKANPLPEAARLKLQQLRETAADLSLSLRASSDRLTEARLAKQQAEAQLRELENPRNRVTAGVVPIHDRYIDESLGRPGSDFGSVSIPIRATVDDAQIGRVRSEIENATAEIARLQKIANERKETWSPLAAILARIDDYILRLPAGITLAEHSDKPAKRKVQTPDLGDLRDQIATLKADLHQVRSAPRPSNEAGRRVVNMSMAWLSAADRGPIIFSTDYRQSKNGPLFIAMRLLATTHLWPLSNTIFRLFSRGGIPLG